jgi:tRNA(Ile)-lysidine synthase
VSRSASAADDATPISSTAELNRLFGGLQHFSPLVLAVSGGPDSTALMVLAARWRGRAEAPRLVAVTVDHGLRKESKREAKAVEQLAHKLGIEHRTLAWTGRKPKTGLQEAARLARYRLLSKAANEVGAGYVLTAHTLDDQAETILFRMARGSGISGLAGMYVHSGVPVAGGQDVGLLRPLLNTPKSRLIATLKAAKIRYASDPTNRDPRFTRPRLRELMPVLAREGLTPSRLAVMARRAQRVEETLSQVVAAAVRRIAPGPWPAQGPVAMKAESFSDLPREVAIRLLGHAIAWTGDEGPVELGKLEALFEALSEPLFAGPRPDQFAKFRRTLAGAVVTVMGDQITVERAPPRRGSSKGGGRTA